ncbi:MAG: hypothetical protein JWR01_1376 [Subtercola sp.]|nr:hypothetical protein [Subtercola sp.]
MFDGLTWTGTDYRRFTGAGLAALNASLCKYGAVSGYGCSRVAQLYVGSQSKVLPEDGGGIYDVYPLTCSRSCWSATNLALARFNLTLWTGP